MSWEVKYTDCLGKGKEPIEGEISLETSERIRKKIAASSGEYRIYNPLNSLSEAGKRVLEKPTIVYEALWCSDVYESSSHTMSIHKTKEGARKAVLEAIKKHRLRWSIRDHNPFDNSQYEKYWNFRKIVSWGVEETELKD